jgi:AcrR family transcriptional regulator
VAANLGRKSLDKAGIITYSFYMETALPKENIITTHHEAREQGHELLRRNVVEAASRLLVQEGPDALTVRRIAQELACSTKVIYTMFKGKDGLADALYQEGCERLRLTIEHVEIVADAESYLRALAQAYWVFAFANPGHYRVMFCGAIPNFVPSKTSIQAAENAFDLCIKSVAHFMQEGKMRDDDPEIVAKTLWAPLHGVINLRFMGHFETLEMTQTVFERIIASLITSLVLPDGDHPA